MLAAVQAGQAPRCGMLLAVLHRSVADVNHVGLRLRLREVETVELDTALIVLRRPGLLLVDTWSGSEGVADRELQRSLARCWRNIDEVLSAGIDVWAPLDASGFSSWAHCQPERALQARGFTRSAC